MKILLLTKKTEHCRQVQDFVKKGFPEATIIKGEVGDPLPNIEWEGDYIISFLSPWIIPESWLNKTKTCINFHPGPPNYPGIGCYNFAIYNREKEYGVLCHHMLPKVDTGKIIKVVRFQMNETDSVFTLKNRSMKHLIELFHFILGLIASKKTLPQSGEKWLRKPYTRKDLQKICRITKDMNEEEVKLRIKATYFSGARDLPYIEIYGNKFTFKKN